MYISGDIGVKEEKYVDEFQASKRFSKKPSLTVNRVDDPVKMYLMQIGELPLLTREEELECAKQIADARKEYLNAKKLEKRVSEIEEKYQKFEKAKEKLANRNLRLVVSVAKKYRCFGLSFLDLIQEGNKGLLTAVDKYDHKIGCRFSTYATHWIKQGIRRAVTEQSRTIRLPHYALELAKKLKKIQNNYLDLNGRMPTPAELADAAGMSFERVINILNASKNPASLDRSAYEDEGRKIKDSIEDKNTQSPVEAADHKLLREKLTEVIDTLPWIEREIIKMRFGIGTSGQTFTLEQIGRVVKKTRERVRQIEAKAVRRLGIPQRSQGLEKLLHY